MIIATAGHIDHGKTTLIAALTGVDTDRLPEEKARGLTIDLGFAYHPLDDGTVLGFIDVPGHERFVRNMLAGVTGIDFALLVIAADDGTMAQTREHLAILDLLDIRLGAVALTKCDIVPADRVDAVRSEIAALLEPTTLSGSPIFAVSGETGEGIPELRSHIETAARDHKGRRQLGPFRLAVDRCFSVTGSGLVATGTAFSGTLNVGDELTLSPQGRTVRVRSIHAQNRTATSGNAGERLGVNVTGSGLKKSGIHRGDWLLAAPAHAPTDRIDGRVRVLETEPRPLRHWTAVHVHMGAAEVTGRVAVLGDKQIAPGTSGLVQLVLDKPVGILHGDRFVLRDRSAQRTIGGGRVIDPFAPKRGRAKPQRLDILAACDTQDPAQALSSLLEQTPGGVDLIGFSTSWNLFRETVESIIDGLGAIRAGSPDEPIAVAEAHWAHHGGAVVNALTKAHEITPDQPGLDEPALRQTIAMGTSTGTGTGGTLSSDVLRTLIDDLCTRGTIQRVGPYLMLPGHRVELTKQDEALWERVRGVLEAGGLRSPIVREIADALDMDHVPVGEFLHRAEKTGLVHKVADNRFFLPPPLLELAEIGEALAAEAEDGVLSVINFRDHAEIGRNLAVEILEYFDKIGFTRRVESGRRILQSANDVFQSMGHA